MNVERSAKGKIKPSTSRNLGNLVISPFIFVSFANIISVHKASSSLLNIPQIHSTVGTLTIRDHTLPYFEFLNMFESRNIGKSAS